MNTPLLRPGSLAASMLYERAVKLGFCSPELVEETALGHIVKKSPVNEIIRRDAFGTWFDVRDVSTSA